MAFEKIIQLKNCRYDYTLSPSVKNSPLRTIPFLRLRLVTMN